MQFAAPSRSLFLPGGFVARQRWERHRQEQERRRKATLGLKRHAEAKIQEHYPEHLFTVEVIPETGDIFVDHPLLKNSGTRFFCRYADYQDGAGAVKLAGEILERAGVHRSELLYYEDYDDARVVEATKTQFKAK